MQKHIPIRMCIACRVRLPQLELHRLQHIDAKLTTFTKRGRSFYICPNCIQNKTLQKCFSRTLKISSQNASELCAQLKELNIDGKQ